MAVLVSIKFPKISHGANGKNSENLIQISALTYKTFKFMLCCEDHESFTIS